MFHVKICGVTTAADAEMVAAAGADAIGLNFVAGSPRHIELTRARDVAAAIPSGVLRVGVFAGSPVDHMLLLARELSLDAIQLHGHLDGGAGLADPPERCRQLVGLPVIRAVRLGACRHGVDPLATARQWIDAATLAGASPAMVIVDAAVAPGADPGRMGGTGERVDWATLGRADPLTVPMAVAGGLTPENVAAAIRITRLSAVDTASGVEAAPGRKDPGKVLDFVAAARAALASI